MRLEVAFVDGTEGEVRLREFLESDRVTGTVFEDLRDPATFSRASVELGCVTWPNGADLAPDAMYHAIRQYGYWLVEPPPALRSDPAGADRRELAERHLLRRQFWKGLLQHARDRRVQLHSGRSPSKHMWLGAGAGRSGLNLNYLVWRQDHTAVELYIDTGDRDENKRIFDAIASGRQAIEEAFGEPLSWERLDQERASRIRYTMSSSGLNAGEVTWPAQWERMVTAMEALAQALKPHIPAS